MAHNLMEDGGRMMFVAGEGTPWHGLGIPLAEPVDPETAVRVIRADFPVETIPVYAKDGDRFVEIPGSRATVGRIESFGGRSVVRPGIDPVYGVVSDRYRVIQALDAASAYRGITGLRIHTGGLLGQGETLWLCGELDAARALFLAGDEARRYVVLANRHDGSGAARMFFTTIRVVCENTLTAALGEAADGIKIRHRGNIGDKIEEAREVLGFAVKFYDRLQKDADRLAAFRPSRSEVSDFFDAVLPVTPEDIADAKARGKAQPYNAEARSIVSDLAAHGRGNARHDGSAWALWNGFTDWSDHHRRGTGPDANRETRFSSLVWGSGARLKSRAFDVLSGMAPAAPVVVGASN